MSDKERIIRLLETVERRSRLNRVLNGAATGLSAALLVPVGFKMLDLISPFRGITVALFFLFWAIATAAWLVWRTRGRDTLESTAANIDKKADTHDEIKSAYWFIRHPTTSAWLEAIIRRAAQNAGRMKIDILYPRRIPRTAYTAAGLVILLGILNFLPLPWNYNWLYLQGAPPFILTEAEKALLEQAKELLKKAEALQESELAEKLAQIARALQDGSMSRDQFSRSLSGLQQALADRKLDLGRITDGLEKIAKALEPSPLTRPVASELFVLDLKDAAEEVRKIAEHLDKSPEAALREMAERLQTAAEVAGGGLEQLTQYLKDAASAMQRLDAAGGQKALEQTAKEFERLQRVLDSQRLRNQASEQISSLQESVQGTPGEVGEGQGEEQATVAGEGEGEGQGEGQGEGTGVGQGEGQGQGQGEGEGEGQGEGEGEGKGEGDGGGRGGEGVGHSGPLPARGDPTSLEVQLQKEAIPVRSSRGSRPETIEEASQRERSKLDYRNVPSELSPAKKDLLNQSPVPMEQRQLIRKYFETVRP